MKTILTIPVLASKTILALIMVASSTHAAETEFTVDPILVKANSSFDSLGEDLYIPHRKVTFERTRAGTMDTMERFLPYPSVNYGFPSGAMGSALGGRSIDDAQVSTLGVPLNLPQGGGPDLSSFPSFLWSGANISTVPALAGFSTQGVSGSIQFDLWTRTQVRELKLSSSNSRITSNIDRNLQNFSIATKKENIAILAGMNFGRQQGPAGSLSYYFIRKPRSHLLFHMIGTEQDGENPGDKNFPTPTQRKKSWRVIPVLESHLEYGDGDDLVTWESTYYADLHQMKFYQPGVTNTSDRTQQYGIENALHWNDHTLALTARLVNYQSSTFGSVFEWPILAQYSHDFKLSDDWQMRLAGGGNWISSVGFAPTTRVSFKQQLSRASNLFFEINSLAKMPTLTARYYALGTYRGNPNLKVERVNALIAGYENEGESLKSTTTFKGEYRNDIQVRSPTTMVNSGNASLFSLMQDLKWKASARYAANGGAMLTYSKLANSSLTYPDLPYFSFFWGSAHTFSDHFKLSHNSRYMGQSTQANGSPHRSYIIINGALDYSPIPGTTFTFGCENLMDNRAEVIADFPLPGRIIFLNLVSNF